MRNEELAAVLVHAGIRHADHTNLIKGEVIVSLIGKHIAGADIRQSP